jgi:hypothetical protein
MSKEHNELTDRQWAFHSDRLKWLDQEITRYRDFEWKATSFHASFFAAVLYLLLGKDSGPVLKTYRWWLGVAIIAYAVIAVSQLVYIHFRLNEQRKNRDRRLAILGQESVAPRMRLRGFWEGSGALFPIGFLVSLLFLAATVLEVLFFA